MSSFKKYQMYGAYHWRDIGARIKCHNPYTAERYRLILRELVDISHSGRLLDFGCGDGALLGMIAKMLPGWGLYGYDPSPTGYELARTQLANHNVKVELVSDTTKLEAASFDVVICAEVIEHVNNPEDLLSELHRVCHPNGHVILTSPIRLTEEPLDPEHAKEYFPKELISLCEGMGLFRVSKSIRAIPAGALAAYQFGLLPFAPQALVSWWMKMVSAWFGVDSLGSSCQRCDLYCIQILRLVPL